MFNSLDCSLFLSLKIWKNQGERYIFTRIQSCSKIIGWWWTQKFFLLSTRSSWKKSERLDSIFSSSWGGTWASNLLFLEWLFEKRILRGDSRGSKKRRRKIIVTLNHLVKNKIFLSHPSPFFEVHVFNLFYKIGPEDDGDRVFDASSA